MHPDAEIILSQPGLGSILGARALGEFGDDPNRYADAKARRCYAGTAPITKASGTRLVVLARVARNRRLADACYLWAFAALSASPGARRCYEAIERRERLTTKPCVQQRTGSSASSMGAFATASSTARTLRGNSLRKRPLDTLEAWDV
jgi:transposase